MRVYHIGRIICVSAIVPELICECELSNQFGNYYIPYPFLF